MQTSDWIASIALVVAGGSLILSLLTYRRDAARLVVEARLVEPLDNPPYITLVVINKGRGTAYLRVIGGGFGKRGRNGRVMPGESGGLRLNHNERYEQNFGSEDLSCFRDGDEIEFERLIVIDSVGKLHVAKGSAKAIRTMRAG